MIRAVLDGNVIMAAIGWGGSARRCLRLVAERRIVLCVSKAILAEYETVVPERLKEEKVEINPEPTLRWVRDRAKFFEPAPLGKQHSRDPKDEAYLGCAVAASARYLVTFDRDLLVLEKPFGIEIIRPAELIRRLR